MEVVIDNYMCAEAIKDRKTQICYYNKKYNSEHLCYNYKA